MASVSVNINGKTYRMACDEGQENHLIALAEKLDSYVGQLKGSFGEIGDQRLTVMAGIMVTDELVELQKRVAKMEAEMVEMRETIKTSTAAADDGEKEAARRLGEIAGRLQGLAKRLGDKPGKPQAKS